MKCPPDTVIIGPFPPPVGGNSVHVARLAHACHARGRLCRIIDPYNRATGLEPHYVIRFNGHVFVRFIKMLIWLIHRSYEVLHIHVSAMDKYLLVAPMIDMCIKKAQCKLITIHSGSFVAKSTTRSRLLQMVMRRCLRSFDAIITVSRHQNDYLRSLMGETCPPTHVIPAFIPPRASHGSLPASVMELRASPLLIVGSGYATSLYAHEILVGAVERLHGLGIDAALVIAVYTEYEEPYYSRLREMQSRVPRTAILRDLSAETFNELLSLADIYVRTTQRDGDCTSIREALFWGCRVVASDCVDRPDGCVKFVTDDMESLLQRLREAAVYGPKKPAVSMARDYASDIIALYEQTAHCGRFS